MPTWLLYTLIALGVIGFGWFIWYIAFGGEEEEDEPQEVLDEAGRTVVMGTTAGEQTIVLDRKTEELRTRKSRMISLQESFEDSLQMRQGPKSGGKDRMSLPWFLLVGSDVSGKTTLLSHSGLPLPYGPPFEVDPTHRDAGRWWWFEEAVVLEAPPAHPTIVKKGSATDTTAEEKGPDPMTGWNTLLQLLRRERPDAPLNGIVVTISCEDLVGSRRRSPEEIGEQADRIRVFLDKTRRILDVRLPIHLVITKCDILPGFRSFTQSLPPARRDDVLGWANPAKLETTFDPQWIDHGFNQLRRSLETLHDEVIAAQEQVVDADGIFVFVSEFAEIQEALRDFVARLMPPAERTPSLFFRGMYFTGDAIDPALTKKASKQEAQAASTMQMSLEAAMEDVKDPHNLVFVRRMFADRVFKEAGLARPPRKLIHLSRDRRVVAAQAAALVFGLVGAAGLYTSVNGFRRGGKTVRSGLRQDVQTLTRVLSDIAIDVDEVKHESNTGADSVLERRTHDAAVVELMGELRDAAPIKLRSPFIPTSWFSPVHAEIRSAIVAGMQDVVLPVTRHRLQERTARLLGPQGIIAAFSDTLDPTDPHSLPGYINEVRALSGNIVRYNRLATPDSGSIPELSTLLEYLFGERPLGPDSTAGNPAFVEVVHRAASNRIGATGDVANAVLARCLNIVNALADSAGRQLAPNARVANPQHDIDALRRLYALVDLSDPKRGLVAVTTDSAIMGKRLARIVQDSINAQLGRIAMMIARDTAAADRAAKLRIALDNLFGIGLMERSQNRHILGELKAGQRLRWNPGALEGALAYRDQLNQAMIIAAQAFPASQSARLRAAFSAQMRARAIDLVAAAARFTPAPTDSIDPAVEIASEVANLREAEPRIMRLATLLDTLKAPTDAQELIAAGARMAEHALSLAYTRFERRQVLVPNAAKVAAWQGVVPIGVAAMGAQDTVGANGALGDQGGVAQQAAREVESARHYLSLPQARQEVLNPKILAFWNGLDTSIKKLAIDPATSSAAALGRYVTVTMAATDRAACQAATTKKDPVTLPPDFFTRRRDQFRAAMIGRCLGAATAINDYRTLRTTFMTRLAGRYPFADSSSGSAPDADPNAVRDFIRQFDAFMITGPVMLQSDPATAAEAKPVIAWLDQISAMRPFFTPFADSGVTRKVPEYTLLVSRTGGADGKGATMQRMVDVGDRSVSVEADEHEEGWVFGEAIKLAASSSDSPDIQTVFSSEGGWSLLRFATRKDPDVLVKLFHPDTKIELRIPVFPTTAPELGGASGAAPATKKP